ncbi:MAG: DUF4271 domain-containing protein [Bacteroidota bacterium]
MPVNDSSLLLTAIHDTDKITATRIQAVSPANTQSSIFKGHQLQPVHDKATFPRHITPDWLTLVLLAIVALFTWYKIFYHRMFLQLVNAFFSMATTNQIVRDESVLLQRASLNASIIFYLAGGLFLYQVSIIYDWNHPWLENDFMRFITFSLIIAILYTAKMLSLRILSNIFNAEKPASSYIFTIFLFNMMAGLLLLPIVVLITYSPLFRQQYFITIVLLILGAILCYRLVRVVVIWMSIPRAPVFYLFLYLCAFEVAPLLLIRKIVLMQG